MIPDFSQKTVDTVAKRAAYRCSNPECRAHTVGPNSEADKATVIGEAAHIFGARPNSARYDGQMSDTARAETTNAIWLCRNCHKLIDRDAPKFTSELIFAWREEHERYVAANLGSTSDRIQFDLESAHTDQFRDYRPLIRRIAIDKPIGWEYRLTAELLRYLNEPVFRRLRDLKENLYTLPVVSVNDDEAIDWVATRLGEMSDLVPPLANLVSRLNASWGPPGQPGDMDEIHHTCLLLRDGLKRIVEFEESLQFVRISDNFQGVMNLLKNCLGSQAEKLADTPGHLDHVVSLVGAEHGGTKEKPLVIEKIITFELSDSWERRMERELEKLSRDLGLDEDQSSFWGGFFTFSIAIGLAAFVLL